MKKIIVLILAICGILAGGNVSAQNIALAKELQQQFNQMRIQGAQASEAEIYNTLYKCYTEYVGVLNAVEATDPSYEEAKKGILEIHQYLYNGAAFHQTRGVKQNALIFAQSYVDITLMDAFKNHTFVKDEQFSTIAYLAASGAYNARNFEQAIPYFAVYLSTGDQRNRESVYAFMAKACIGVKNTDLAMSVLEEGISQYPKNYSMLTTAINCCIDNEDNENLQRYVTLALAVNPNDETLLNIQGKLYEDNQEFEKALDVYKRLNGIKPNNLTIMQHLALNEYNLGVFNYNQATIQETESEARMYSDRANSHFSLAISRLDLILANTPNSVKYMQALAVAHDCLGNQSDFEAINTKLASMGAATVDANVTPTLLTHAAKGLTSGTTQSTGTANNNTVSKSNMLALLAQQSSKQVSDKAPLFSAYAKDYVEPRIKAWQEKDPYETVAEYQERVSEETRAEKVKELLKTAEANYIKSYAKRVRIEDMKLKPYDADHQAFLIQSEFGELIVPVPRDKDQARIFETNWNGMQVKDPEFYISNDKMLLSELTFVSPTGTTYRYDGKRELNYTETVVDMSFDPIDSSDLLASNSNNASNSRVKKQSLTIDGVKSDVDVNIPEGVAKHDNLYALIIANENYSMVSSVPFALNDGEMFAEYCEKTLGVPEKNVLLYKDASFGIMLNAIDKIKKIATARGGDMELLFYYAGHGIPDESSKDAYLLPIDSDGKQTKVCYSLNDIYNNLGKMDAKMVTVFLDACFSGAKRDGGMVAEARAVSIKPKESAPTGNMVVFSAVSDDETALPYKEKGHGMFTYFLLKKMQETKGDVTLKDLADYVKSKVASESILINDKSQTPTVKASQSTNSIWQSLKLGKN